MREATSDQRKVLDSTARIRIVRAVPGSGKTWLVAELMRQELAKWTTRTSGIAALSFTRVGGEEIRKAIGCELGHPHFVGTIDSFVFRYIVRPFFQRCFSIDATPRLIPSEWEAEHWYKRGHNLNTTVGQGINRINLLSCVFINEENNKAVIAHKPHPAQPLRRLNSVEFSLVEEEKKRGWAQSGRITHSDAAFLACRVLEHNTFGAAILAEIVRRFPLIIVDELQDTGYFLGKSIRHLLNEPLARGVLVGDPDQAIYEFTGAHPDLFESFESIPDAVSLPLSSSLRCPVAVSSAATNLKGSAGSIGSDNCNEGRAYLLQYSDMVTDVHRMTDAIVKAKGSNSIKVIARQTATIHSLTVKSHQPAPKLGCPAITHLHRAVIMLRRNRSVAALANARAALELTIFGYEGIDDTTLKESNIDPTQWKRLAVDCLFRANAEPVSGNVYDWQAKVGVILDEEIVKFGLNESFQFAAGNLKPQKRGNEWSKDCANYLPKTDLPITGLSGVPVMTVHGVKGETHDVTIFVCPEPRRASHCPSRIWWSADYNHQEEKRIAYVAMTRTQGDLIICVSANCYARLRTERPQFVASFICKKVDEYISEIECGVLTPA